MRLSELIGVVEGATVQGPADIEVRGLTHDSRAVRAGDVFFAVRGGHVDGAAFITDAVRKGAVAVVAEAAWFPAPGVAAVSVPSVRGAMASMARLFRGMPDRRLKMVGVTGTNGKTTTTFLVRHLLERAGVRCGLMGTVRYEMGDRILPAARTTPESCEFYWLLSKMIEEGCGAAAIEVSSHALAQDRVAGAEFDVAVFTNLSRDHLDFHPTMGDYFEAKRRLFTGHAKAGVGATAVINAGDERGRRLLDDEAVAFRKVSYGACGADIGWKLEGWTPTGGRVEFSAGAEREAVFLPLVGEFNLENAAAAIGSAMALGMAFRDAVRWLGDAPPVPGRLERVPGARGFSVLVDYAHTDDALAKALGVLKGLPHRRLICVFGCGGDRDRSKRPLMGRAASTLADLVLLTSDNPRGEEPAAIISEILAGLADGTAHEVIQDRRAAIRRAIEVAGEGDIVLIAGKGHETYQEIAGARFPFDDREVAAAALGERCAG